MTGNTPTPWKVSWDGRARFMIVSAEHDIALINCVPFVERKANADLIVMAVNSHSAMVEALEQALDCIRDEPVEDMTRREAEEDTVAKIKAALALCRSAALTVKDGATS